MLPGSRPADHDVWLTAAGPNSPSRPFTPVCWVSCLPIVADWLYRGSVDDRRVVVVGLDGLEMIDVACMTSGFEHANRLGADGVRGGARHSRGLGRAVRSDTGLELRGQGGGLDTITGGIDTLVVSGGLGHENAAANTRLLGKAG